VRPGGGDEIAEGCPSAICFFGARGAGTRGKELLCDAKSSGGTLSIFPPNIDWG